MWWQLCWASVPPPHRPTAEHQPRTLGRLQICCIFKRQCEGKTAVSVHLCHRLFQMIAALPVIYQNIKAFFPLCVLRWKWWSILFSPLLQPTNWLHNQLISVINISAATTACESENGSYYTQCQADLCCGGSVIFVYRQFSQTLILTGASIRLFGVAVLWINIRFLQLATTPKQHSGTFNGIYYQKVSGSIPSILLIPRWVRRKASRAKSVLKGQNKSASSQRRP